MNKEIEEFTQKHYITLNEEIEEFRKEQLEEINSLESKFSRII